MGLIRFYFAASLDGFIADPDGGVGFLDPFHTEGHGIEKFLATVSVLVMGAGRTSLPRTTAAGLTKTRCAGH